VRFALDRSAPAAATFTGGMLHKAQLREIIGRRRLERLLAAKWIAPVSVNGRTLFDERSVRQAVRRLEREGYRLSGYGRKSHFAFLDENVPAQPKPDPLADLDLEGLF
jgi:hypothetical protein